MRDEHGGENYKCLCIGQTGKVSAVYLGSAAFGRRNEFLVLKYMNEAQQWCKKIGAYLKEFPNAFFKALKRLELES